MERLENIVSKILGIEPSEVNDSLSYHEIPSWDSLNHLELVAKIEQEYLIELSIDEVMSMNNIKNIKKILSTKVINE